MRVRCCICYIRRPDIVQPGPSREVLHHQLPDSIVVLRVCQEHGDVPAARDAQVRRGDGLLEDGVEVLLVAFN